MEMVDDLLLLILVWLPVKSLLRFKTVCKSWRSLIESSTFISQHLHHLDDDDDSWNFITLEPSQPRFSLLSGNNFQFSHTLPFQNELGIRPEIIATCDGIVCLQHGDYPDISLWNPATRQFTTLPKAPQPLPFIQDWVKFSYGFGLDLKTNDYKVVKIVIETVDIDLFDTDDDDDVPIPHSKVTTNVYSLSTNSWRTVDAVLPVDEIIHNPKFPLRNGIYCWLGAAYVDEERRLTLIQRIFYFDFTTEMFGTIPLPDACGNTWLNLGLIKDNIACIKMCGLVSTGVLHEIWVLNQYDANPSWTKLSTITIKIAAHLLGTSKNGKIFWKISYTSGPTTVYLVDPITQKKKILPIEGTSYHFQGAVYKESLLSIKGAVDATAT